MSTKERQFSRTQKVKRTATWQREWGNATMPNLAKRMMVEAWQNEPVICPTANQRLNESRDHHLKNHKSNPQIGAHKANDQGGGRSQGWKGLESGSKADWKRVRPVAFHVQHSKRSERSYSMPQVAILKKMIIIFFSLFCLSSLAPFHHHLLLWEHWNIFQIPWRVIEGVPCRWIIGHLMFESTGQ